MRLQRAGREGGADGDAGRPVQRSERSKIIRGCRMAAPFAVGGQVYCVIDIPPYRGGLPAGSQVSVQSLFAEFTGRAMSAAVADDAVVAGQRLIADDIKDAQFVSQGPGFLFIQPHERCDEIKGIIHGQVQRRVQGFDKYVPGSQDNRRSRSGTRR